MMDKKKIGFFVSSTSWSNFQQWHFQTANALYSRGYQVIVFTKKKSRLYSKLRQKGIEVVAYKPTNFLIADLIKFSRLLTKYYIHTLFISYPGDIRIAGFAKKFSTLKRLYFRKGTVSKVRTGILNKIVFSKYVTGVITNSMANKESMLLNKKQTFKNTKIDVVYQGLKLEEYKEKSEKTPNHREKDKILIGLTNCSHYNNYCLEFLKIIKNHVDQEKFKFLIYQNSNHPHLHKKIKKLRLDKSVVRDFHASNIKEFMESIDVYLSPVAANSFNYSLLYAMVYQKPVIGIKKGSNTEIIRNKENGFLIDEDDIKSLREALELITDKDTRIKIGLEAERTVREKFNFERSIDQIESII